MLGAVLGCRGPVKDELCLLFLFSIFSRKSAVVCVVLCV